MFHLLNNYSLSWSSGFQHNVNITRWFNWYIDISWWHTRWRSSPFIPTLEIPFKEMAFNVEIRHLNLSQDNKNGIRLRPTQHIQHLCFAEKQRILCCLFVLITTLAKLTWLKNITEPLMLFIFFFFFSFTHNLIERCDLLSLALWIYRLSIWHCNLLWQFLERFWRTRGREHQTASPPLGCRGCRDSGDWKSIKQGLI